MICNWRAGLLGFSLVLVAGVRPASVSAFSEPKNYGEDPAKGGGGGRWFTGSPADGYGCSACHSGPGSVPVEVKGLPSDGYVQGTTYTVKLSWASVATYLRSLEARGLRPSTSVVAEFVAEDGTNSGEVFLEPEVALPPELCQPITNPPQLAATIFSTPPNASTPSEVVKCSTNQTNQRCVVAVRSCGSSELRMRWTAPAQWRGPIWFSAGFVTTENATGIPNDNDFVTELVVPMNAAVDGPVYETTLGGGCSVVQAVGASGRTRLWQALGLFALALLGMRSRARRWPLLAAGCVLALSGCYKGKASGDAGESNVGLYTPGYKVTSSIVNAVAAAGSGGSPAEDTGRFCQKGISHDAGDSDAGAGNPGGMLTVELTTSLPHGDYDKTADSFVNAGGIWIEDDQGHFVKTLKYWIALQYPFTSVKSYVQKRFFCPGGPDVMTGATLRVHAPQTVSWSGKDTKDWVVPDGNYILFVEVQIDEKHTQPVAMFPFVKGRDAWTKMMPPTTPLSALTLTYTPTK